MRQRNYKALILKLSGTALGLVVMLAAGAVLGQIFMFDKAEKNDVYAFAYATGSVKEFGVLSETDVGDIQLTLADLKADMVADLSDAIRNVAEQTSIPTALREDIIAGLTRELERNEHKIQALEDSFAKFSYKVILPRSKYSHSPGCSEEAVLEESGDKENNRDSRKAFSWI